MIRRLELPHPSLTQRALLRLGEATALRQTGQLDRIIAALQAHAEGRSSSSAAIAAEAARSAGGVAAVAAYWERVGLDDHFCSVGATLGYSLTDAVFAMVANRLLSPCSKRQLCEWVVEDVAMPPSFSSPSLDQYYWSLDHVERAKEATEDHLYRRLTDLTNLDLRLVCYDLTSSYFETHVGSTAGFPSRAFGFSRDHRGDRPQVVLGLLTTGDGIPIAHHVFAGNTADVSTLPGVLSDLARRFGVRKVCFVADRGLVSEDNVAAVTDAGFDHVIATRLHNTKDTEAVLRAATAPRVVWRPVASANTAAADVSHGGVRYVVALSWERWRRDQTRTEQLVDRTESELLRLEARVRQGQLKSAVKIAEAAGRILSRSGVARLFDTEIGEGRFLYHYDSEAMDYESELLAGRYILRTSLSPHDATAAEVVMAYRRLLEVESTFRVLKDVIALRPMFHWTERRVRGHIAVCVLAAVIEALMAADLAKADVRDPDILDQALSTRRALRELERIRTVTLTVGERTVDVVTRRSALQAQALHAFGVDTSQWDKAHIR